MPTCSGELSASGYCSKDTLYRYMADAAHTIPQYSITGRYSVAWLLHNDREEPRCRHHDQYESERRR
jgi:hypothetical protein